MKNLIDVKQILVELSESTGSPIFTMSEKIVDYLVVNPQQQDLTIGGLRAALELTSDSDKVLVQAAYTLASYPFEVLVVYYQLFNESLDEVQVELDHSQYMTAVKEGCLIDDDGNELSPEVFQRRIFPYFVNISAVQSSRDDISRGLLRNE